MAKIQRKFYLCSTSNSLIKMSNEPAKQKHLSWGNEVLVIKKLESKTLQKIVIGKVYI